jgi:uncharacterized protein YbjT (DUF2867 family)
VREPVRSPVVARILIVGGGCRGRRLAAQLAGEGAGHVVRITTRSEAGRGAIEAVGAECVIGTPDRLATLHGALEGITIVCWLLATAAGDAAQLQALHGSRLELFLSRTIDTTVRGLVYEAPCEEVSGTTGSAGVAAGERIVREATSRNAIPVAFVRADPRELEGWLEDAREAVDSLLGVRYAES